MENETALRGRAEIGQTNGLHAEIKAKDTGGLSHGRSGVA